MSKNKLSEVPKVNMSVLPTPMYKLENLSRGLFGNVYCKRDDLTGFALGGNKTRKLDYLVADALMKGCDTLIGIGANQSNFCRMASGAGIVNNFDVQLVLGGSKPDKPTGNLLIDHMFSATVHHVESEEWSDWEERASELEEKISKKGRKAYLMPIGGSNPVGALGYVSAFFEIMEDCERLGVKIDYIVHASASAGTQAGLLVGKEISGWEGEIIGIGVAKTKEQLAEEVYDLALKTGEQFGVIVDKDNVIVDNSFMGEKYGALTVDGAKAVNLFAIKEGILLDYSYTGKAAAGLINYSRRGIFMERNNVLFIHTGGYIHLFK
jgi:D-cysteine desulfhydrase family pyridoxal phosphate-dependent enzyme